MADMKGGQCANACRRTSPRPLWSAAQFWSRLSFHDIAPLLRTASASSHVCSLSYRRAARTALTFNLRVGEINITCCGLFYSFTIECNKAHDRSVCLQGCTSTTKDGNETAVYLGAGRPLIPTRLLTAQIAPTTTCDRKWRGSGRERPGQVRWTEEGRGEAMTVKNERVLQRPC